MATQDEKIKWVEGSPFMVDGFRFTNPRCKHYLLTHFHSDHTTGLSKSFSAGTIYTSQGTASLVTELIGVNAERVVALPMNKPVVVAGFELTLIDANHCPAAVMFVIRDTRPGGRTSLHTGDFRADASVCTNPVVTSLKGKVDSLYLDTTYCGPRHTFPDQREVLAQAARLVRMELQRDSNTLFLVGTYSIGKERVLEAVAKAAGSRCLVISRKARILRLSGAWDEAVFTTHDATTGGGLGGYARVRAVPLQDTNSPTTLLGVLAEAKTSGAPFTSVVGVRPTGWTHTNARKGGSRTAAGDGSQQLRAALTGSGAAGTGAAPAMPLSKENSEGFRDSYADGVFMAGDGEAPLEGDDQDDEAAAWGAGGSGGGLEKEGERGAVEAPPQAQAEGSWSGKKPWTEGNARVYSLPYSEHSSYTQLKDFVRAVRPKTIVPTVNASSAASVEKMLGHFLEFMDLSRDRKRLESYFCKPSAPSSCGGNGGRLGPTTPSATCGPSAGKRPKISSVASALRPSTKKISPNPKAGSRNRGTGGALKPPYRPPSSPAPLRERENAKTADAPRPGSVPNPYVTVSRPALSSPCLAAPSRAAATCGSTRVASPPVRLDATGDAPVVLDLVDVEAQKAIMADIERRRREQQQEQQEQQQPPPRGAGAETIRSATTPRATPHASRGARRGKALQSPEGPAAGEGGSKACNKAAGRGGPASSGKRTRAGRGGSGRSVASPSGRRGVTSDALTAAVDAVDEEELGQRGLAVGEGSAMPAGSSPGTMNIRDFFSRRG